MRLVVLICAGLALAGCVTTNNPAGSIMAEIHEANRRDPEVQMKALDTVAASLGFERYEVKTSTFTVVVRMKPKAPSSLKPEIAINGDAITGVYRDTFGNEFPILPVQAYPVDPAVFMDQASKVRDIIILERPCYAVTIRIEPKCSDHHWWGKNSYSEPVITAMSEAIDFVKQHRGAPTVSLIGHSAGGGLSLLIAARRDDVTSVVTTSAALDFDAIVAYQVRALSIPKDYRIAGKSPVDLADRLSKISQLHIYGTMDSIIPQENWSNYRAALGGAPCVKFEARAMDHSDEQAFALWRRGVNPPLAACQTS